MVGCIYYRDETCSRVVGMKKLDIYHQQIHVLGLSNL